MAPCGRQAGDANFPVESTARFLTLGSPHKVLPPAKCRRRDPPLSRNLRDSEPVVPYSVGAACVIARRLSRDPCSPRGPCYLSVSGGRLRLRRRTRIRSLPRRVAGKAAPWRKPRKATRREPEVYRSAGDLDQGRSAAPRKRWELAGDGDGGRERRTGPREHWPNGATGGNLPDDPSFPAVRRAGSPTRESSATTPAQLRAAAHTTSAHSSASAR